MELETLKFSVIDVSLEITENMTFSEPRLLSFSLRLASEAAVVDQEGRSFRSITWFLRVAAKNEGDDSIFLEGNIGTLRYIFRNDKMRWCSALICIDPLKFQSLVEALMHGRRVSQVAIGVRGLYNAGNGLVWPQSDGVELPIEEAGFSVELFSRAVS